METLGHFAVGSLISLLILRVYDRSRFRYPKYRAYSIIGGVWSMLPHIVPNQIIGGEQRQQLFLSPTANIFFFHWTIDSYDKTVFWPEQGPALEPYVSLMLAVVYIAVLLVGIRFRSSGKEY